jgi:hypothetical protein
MKRFVQTDEYGRRIGTFYSDCSNEKLPNKAKLLIGFDDMKVDETRRFTGQTTITRTE